MAHARISAGRQPNLGDRLVLIATLIGLPIGSTSSTIPTHLTLRPRTREVQAVLDEPGQIEIRAKKRSQVAWPLRLIWFVLIGCARRFHERDPVPRQDASRGH
jgi:hypothetical protein